MDLNFWRKLCCLMLVLMLVACGSHLQPSADLAETSQHNFMKAMRWNKFRSAARYLVPEHRKDFLETFLPLKDIHIVDVKLVDLLPSKENRRFDTTIEMEYYLPPSMTVKTLNLDQTWSYFDGEDPTRQGFLISTPFPDFP